MTGTGRLVPADRCLLRPGMHVTDRRCPNDSRGVTLAPDQCAALEALYLHGPEWEADWVWVRWRYGTRCLERRADLLVIPQNL